jgi:peptidoglycan-associated lipoprotein
MPAVTFALLALTASLTTGCAKQAAPLAPVVAPPPIAEPVAPIKEVERMVQNFNRVFFEYDSGTLAAASMRALDDNVRIMQENPDIRVEIQGHADERGTTDYNLALGQRRANAVMRYMGSVITETGRLRVVSYGEERPLEMTTTERAWSQNRRCEFRVLYGDLDIINGTTDA